MDSIDQHTPARRNLKRISGTSKALWKQQSRKKKSRIRRRKLRRSIFGNVGNCSSDDQTKQLSRSQIRKEKRKAKNERFYALQKKQRRSELARNTDKKIRNRMFHITEEKSIVEKVFETADENDCILIEDISDVILIDDDDEKDQSTEEIKVKLDDNNDLNNSNCSANATLYQKTIRERLLEISSDKLIMKTTPFNSAIGEDSLEIGRVSDLVHADKTGSGENVIENVGASESRYLNGDCALASKENIPKEEKSVLLLESETSEEETSKSEKSEDETSETVSSASLDDNDQQEKPLFFEDNTGNVHMNQSEIPIYTGFLSKSNIFNSKDLNSDEVVYISSTPLGKKRKKTRNKRKLDDSVIFISEEPAQKSIDVGFLPLETHSADSNEKFHPSRKRRKNDKLVQVTPAQKKAVGNADLFTASEKKRIAMYNSNTYNPNPQSLPQGKRMVIIDGSNVAYGHACGNQFSVKGIQIAIEYFEKIGHEVKAVVPQKRRQRTFSSDPELLTKLHKEGKVVFTPCKHLPGNSSTSYDDRFILQLAIEFDAAIVSNDNYRDLIHENSAFKKIIESRVIGYTWCNDLFMLPKDPYGRNGPALSVILNRV